MRRLLSLAVLVSVMNLPLLLSGKAYAAGTTHVYNSGIVSSFGNNQISIESGTYTLRPDVKVIRIVKDEKGAYYQRKGSLSDVSTGKRVHLKSRGVMVYEIEVEG